MPSLDPDGLLNLDAIRLPLGPPRAQAEYLVRLHPEKIITGRELHDLVDRYYKKLLKRHIAVRERRDDDEWPETIGE